MRFLTTALVILSLSLLRGAELAEAVADLKAPTLTSAKASLEKLEALIRAGDPRTVTLGKKMERSIKRIFIHERKVQQARERTEADEAKAKQFEDNGRKWLQPNAHGRRNKLSAAAAFRDARLLRFDNIERQKKESKAWREEVADYERMLGDLEFSGEEEALLILAELLRDIVTRTAWVDRPVLKYDELRIQVITKRVKNREGWRALAAQAAEAEDYELAYHFYGQAGDSAGRAQTGLALAEALLKAGFPGTAINYWERLGQTETAKAVRLKFPQLKAEHFAPLDSAALERNIAPACVRVCTQKGVQIEMQSGFFVGPSGVVVTAQVPDQPTSVILADGRRFPARVLATSGKLQASVLKIDYEGNEFLPLGVRADLKAGTWTTLFGFATPESLEPVGLRGAVLASFETWKGMPTCRVALEGSSQQRGGPVVDHRGRVMGLFLKSQTGVARATEIDSLRAFLETLRP